MKVLVVDDEPDIRRIAKLGLSRVGGMEVVEAANGMEALVRAKEDKPDAVLLDVMMPRLDGPSTLARLREELLRRVNAVVQPTKVNDVLFQEVLLQ